MVAVPTRSIAPEDGAVDAGSPGALKAAGNAALKKNDVARAAHMYTLAIDLVIGNTDCSSLDEPATWYGLNQASGGVLHTVLSNRSLCHYKQGDWAAAAEDAEHCCCAQPDFVKGHLRLLAAMTSGGRSQAEQLKACTRAVKACPTCKELEDRLVTLGGSNVAPSSGSARASGPEAAQLVATRKVADDPADPRRALAAGDLGSALAVGAYGLVKDVVEAEKYLSVRKPCCVQKQQLTLARRIGSEGGDAASQRNLGLLLLELERAAEGSEQLRMAAKQGDEAAISALSDVAFEAKKKVEEARLKLRALASQGDERARAMLEQLANEGQQ